MSNAFLCCCLWRFLAGLTCRKFQVSNCVISPDGSWLASAVSGKSIRITDIKSEMREIIYTFKCTNVRSSFYVFVLTIVLKVCGMAWSPDSKSLIAVTRQGCVIQITNNNAHSTVYKNIYSVCSMLAAISLLISCLVEWMRVQSQWDPCCRWI